MQSSHTVLYIPPTVWLSDNIPELVLLTEKYEHELGNQSEEIMNLES